MATKPPRLYVPLDVYYADDDKVERLSARAELMWIRVLCEAKKRPDRAGLVTLYGLKRAASGKFRSIETALRELQEVGLVVAVDLNGKPAYQIVSWTSWNMDETESDKRRQARAAGGFIRAHKAGQHVDSPSAECPQCSSSSSASAQRQLSKRRAKRREEKTSSLREEEGFAWDAPKGAASQQSQPVVPIQPEAKKQPPKDWDADLPFAWRNW